MPPDADEDAGEPRLGRLGEIDDLGDVRQIVAAKGDDIGLPAHDRAEIGAPAFDLQVDQPNRVPGLPRRRGYQFEADWLQPEKNLRVGQRARMDAEQPHRILHDLPSPSGSSAGRPILATCVRPNPPPASGFPEIC